MHLDDYMFDLGRRAREASRVVAASATASRNAALVAIAEAIDNKRVQLAEANAADQDKARRDGLESALVDRLSLGPGVIDGMIAGLHQIAALADPVGAVDDLRVRPSGIQVGRMRVPLGVVGIIYESRPNVTVDAAALCLKSGNAAILRGGSEAFSSNQILAGCLRQGLEQAGLPPGAVQVLDTTDRRAVDLLVGMRDWVDVIVPRGGKGLIARVIEHARVPVIKHLHGICHVYVDHGADLAMATAIADNAKTQRYGTCNTMETLLVAQGEAPALFQRLLPLYHQKGVELRGCKTSCRLAPEMLPARDEDWDTEYLAPILSVRVVDGLEQAIAHINRHGSGHTEAIVTSDWSRAQRFLREVDASSVMVNTSTRFADGFEYGLGAEIGISTDKFHVRGPVGLEGLTSQKWIVLGDGQIRR